MSKKRSHAQAKRRRRVRPLSDGERATMALALQAAQDKKAARRERWQRTLIECMEGEAIPERSSGHELDRWELQELSKRNAGRRTVLAHLPASAYEATNLSRYLTPARPRERADDVHPESRG